MPSPAQHHLAEQRWAMAKQHLESVLDNIRGESDFIARMTESHDPSAIFDYILSVLRAKNRTEIGSWEICEIVCAAALTYLASMPKATDPLEDIPTLKEDR